MKHSIRRRLSIIIILCSLVALLISTFVIYITINNNSALLSENSITLKAEINKGMLFSSVLTLLIVIIIGLIISKKFSGIMKEISNTSVDLFRGNYGSKINKKSNIEEIENLIESINSLGEKLNSQDLLRKRMISDIAHEIRTPLNVLQNNLEAMIDGIIPITNEKLNNLNEEVIRFGKLLNNLESLKGTETDEMSLNLQVINIEEIILSVINDFSIKARRKNIQLVINKERNKDFVVLGDYDKLKQVFINLISNGIKFTKVNGKVDIKLNSNSRFVKIEVRDNGIGIKKEDLPYIFERMYRGDKSRNKIQGSGIGLTIVKKILTFHCATIDVESKEGIGTKFTVCISRNNKFI